MAGRSRDTYKKRQKEVARAEKAREKAARRMERKQQKKNPELGPDGEPLEDNLEDNLDDADNLDETGDAELPVPMHGGRPVIG
jgi:hypothetical protein